MSKKPASKKPMGMPKSPSSDSNVSQSIAPTPKMARYFDDEHSSPTGVVTYGQYLFDCSTLLIHCPKHNNIALTKISGTKGYFLPFTALRETEGWFVAVVNKLKHALALPGDERKFLSFSPPELVHLLRLQVPGVCKFVNRITYLTELSHDEKHPTNCCQQGKIVWVPALDISRGSIAEIWGPEPAFFADAFTNKTLEKGGYTEFTLREAYRFTTREQPTSFQEDLLLSAKMGHKEVSKLYVEFLQHCYPSQYLVFYSFADYFSRLGWTNSDMDLSATYRSFSSYHRSYLSFHEFLFGVAAMDKHTAHGGRPGELRCGYIFRYYDANCDGLLDRQEMYNLTADVLKTKNKPHDREAVEREMIASYAALRVNTNEPINLQQLISGIGTLALRGSAGLFRSSFSIIAQINLKRMYDSVSMLHVSVVAEPGGSRTVKGICPKCRMKRYSMAVHTLRVTGDGKVVEPVEIPPEEVPKPPKDKRAASVQAFSSENIGAKVIEWIREFVEQLKLEERSKGSGKLEQTAWFAADRVHVATSLLKLFSETEVLFKSEARCVKLNSPTYVLGDIHGNLHDLMIFEKVLWEKGPHCSPVTCLFLGDYVDRGEFSLEVVVYLFGYKLLNPEKYVLLRGNHEVRHIQAAFTFQKECTEKFGKLGLTVWEACNRVFDYLPLCAIIDDAIFCAHGGIPTSVVKVEELDNIPTPLTNVERQSPAAWELLWNDPITPNDFNEYLEMLRAQNEATPTTGQNGFLPNTKRGTAYFFAEEAVRNFLASNGLSYIIRAHEMVPPGYAFHIGGRVMTIFSCSRYCNGNNDAACVYIEQEKLRILRLDTS